MKSKVDAQTATGLTKRALRAGVQLETISTAEWEISGECLNPVYVGVNGRPIVDHPKTIYRKARFVDLWVRCRRCAKCLRARAAYWRLMARAECEVAVRTWFGTLTLSPESRVRALYLAERRLRSACVPREDWTEDRVFSEKVRAVNGELTRWLKRIRKESAAPLRYCLVVERHKSGDPHWHVLIHEQDADRPVRHRVLRDQWKLGFSRFTLADKGSAGYVAKYLSKDALARVRASVRYGKVTPVGIGAL